MAKAWEPIQPSNTRVGGRPSDEAEAVEAAEEEWTQSAKYGMWSAVAG